MAGMVVPRGGESQRRTRWSWHFGKDGHLRLRDLELTETSGLDDRISFLERPPKQPSEFKSHHGANYGCLQLESPGAYRDCPHSQFQLQS